MADAIFVGGAPVVKQISTGTVAGTPANGNTFTVTCNSKSLIVTIPATGITTDQVAAEIASSVMANSPTDPAPATGYTRNVGGREIPEFRDFEAYSSGSVVYFRSLSSIGQPFTITLSESGGATTFTLATPTAATGPCHFDDAANYRAGALPVDGDSIDAEGDVDILFGLTLLSGGTLSCHLDIDISKYTGQIGLPEFNTGGYDEYRQRTLVHYSSDASKSISLRSESGQTTSSKPIYITPGASSNALKILGGRGNPSTPNIVIDGTGADEFTGASSILRGSVLCDGVNFQESLSIGANSGTEQDCRVTLRNCDLTDAPNVWFYSGAHILASDTEYSGGGTETNIRIYGGTVTVQQASGSNLHRPFEVYQGGTLLSTSNAVLTTEIQVFSGGILDMRKTSTPQNITAVKLHAGSSLYDPQGLAGDGTNTVYQFIGCSPGQLSVAQLPANLQYTTDVLP